ncbi:MAG: PilZ domain-containing protein [Candidatus Aceula meridiana]|nr:PilZ domain-containing protein [Candidatus Aceula meridiana]
MDSSEKRRYLRFRIFMDVDVIGFEAKNSLKGTLENISRQGIGIILKKGKKPKGTEVDLNLHLDSQKKPVSARGRITWIEEESNKNRLGVEIKRIDKEVQDDILDIAYQDWKAQI